MTSIGNVLKAVAGAGSMYVPFLTVGIGLARVFTAVTSTVAITPLADAAIALVPGLCCQSKTENNYELQRLRRVDGQAGALPDYYFVRSDFEPAPAGWRFWRRFVNWKGELVNMGADLVFEDRNDLVVDTSSMDSLADGPAPKPDHLLDFGTTATVHHCNYFLQPETLKLLSSVLLKH